jgi:hypothetical protein
MRVGVPTRFIRSAAIRTMSAITIIRFGGVLAPRGPRRPGVTVLRLNPRIGEGPGLPASGGRLRAIVNLFLTVLSKFS